MKIGGGLNYVTGPMGSGKSLKGVREIIDAATSGRYAITNVRLLDGWEHTVARRIARTAGAKRREKIAAKLARAYVYETELHEAMRYRIPGRGEGRAVFVWDESHNDLNNRTYRDRDQALLEWATQLRKLGFIGFLLSQHHENTDAQLRRICNYLIRLQNQREQTRALGLRITPWPLFIAVWIPAHTALASDKMGRVKPARIERYFLSWHRKLYDTHDLYHGLASDIEPGRSPILLPSLSGAGVGPEGASRAAREEHSATLEVETPRGHEALPITDHAGEVRDGLPLPQ